MNTNTFSVRLDHATKARLQKLSKSTGRSRAFLAAEAIEQYLDSMNGRSPASLAPSPLLSAARVSRTIASRNGLPVGDPQRAPHTQSGMKLTWSRDAVDDLVSLRAHISVDDPAARKHIALHILHCIEKLLPQNPKLGHPGRVPGTFESAGRRRLRRCGHF